MEDADITDGNRGKVSHILQARSAQDDMMEDGNRDAPG